jgi:SAM-dependent methyltransferase
MSLALLNIGCGRHFHPAWRNLDVVSRDPQVEACDLRRGLPAPDNHYDMVYHSHVLEHLPPEQGAELIAECRRVLKPGGILRIVVPDLETTARLYLQSLEAAWEATPVTRGAVPGTSHADLALAQYEWFQLELLDQMVRQQSGGRMGPYLQQATGDMRTFLEARLGREVQYADSQTKTVGTSAAAAPRRSWRTRWARRCLRWLLGPDSLRWLAVGQFLDSGEVHRWMYDRLSLRHLCQTAGLIDFQICAADQSSLPDYAQFQLDQVGGDVRKPDSIFVECRKPQG